MKESKKKKILWCILVILIIAVIVSIIVIINKKNETKEPEGMIMPARDYNKEFEIENNAIKSFEGNINGRMASELLLRIQSSISAYRSINSPIHNKIVTFFDGNKLNDNEIFDLKINEYNKYNVSFKYASDGFVEEVYINEIKED